MCTLHMSFGITVGSAPKAKSVLTSSVVSVESSSASMTANARRGTYEKALIVRLDPHRIQSAKRTISGSFFFIAENMVGSPSTLPFIASFTSLAPWLLKNALEWSYGRSKIAEEPS
jgi:hypothetical protein